MTWEALLLIAGAGFLGGAVNAAAGGGTLISFPALMAAGLPPLQANVTSSVGMLTGYAGGAIGYRRELKAQGPRLLSFGITALLGGILGALLLLVTDPSIFDGIVPFLVIGSAVLLAVQPFLAARLKAKRAAAGEGEAGSEVTWAAQFGIFVASVYGSYFGAGLGVLLLAVMGIFLSGPFQSLNGLKSLISLLVNAVGVVIFLFSGLVDPLAVAVLAPAALLGGTVGAQVARKVPDTVLRVAVIVLGLVVGISMLFR